MQRRSPKGRKRFEEHQRSKHAIIELTQAECQSLKAMDRGQPGKKGKREVFASRGLLTSSVASRMMLTPLAHNSIRQYEKKIGEVALGKKDACKDNKEANRERWLFKHAPPFKRSSF